MKTAITNLFLISAFSIASHAQTASPSYELSCRAKAKGAAAETYKGCVTEGRQAEVEKVRQEYQEKIKTLKAQYERDLKQAAGSKSTTTAAAAPASTPAVSKAKEVKITNDDSTMDIPEPIESTL